MFFSVQRKVNIIVLKSVNIQWMTGHYCYWLQCTLHCVFCFVHTYLYFNVSLFCHPWPSSTYCFLQVDVRTIHGSTPLCNACAAGSLECAKLLLSYGANVNPSLTALTASPLHEACIRGKLPHGEKPKTKTDLTLRHTQPVDTLPCCPQGMSK